MSHLGKKKKKEKSIFSTGKNVEKINNSFTLYLTRLANFSSFWCDLFAL